MNRVNPRTLGANCDACPLQHRKPVTPNHVAAPRHKTLALVGQTPGKQEEKRNAFYVGGTGELLNRRILQHQDVKIRRRDLHITNAILCNPNNELEPKELRRAVECCRPRLARELAEVNPGAALLLGKWANWAVTGRGKSVEDYIGAPGKGLAFKRGGAKKGVVYADFSDLDILVGYPPAMVFRDKWQYLPVIRIMFGRAWKLATGNLPRWKWPPFYLHANQEAEAALKRILASDRWVSVDVESGGKDPWTAKILCIGVSNNIDTVSIPWHSYSNVVGVTSKRASKVARRCRDLMRDILRSEKHVKIYQNGCYDRMCFRVWGEESRPPYFDTMYAHMLLAPELPHRESFQAAVEFHADRWKEDFKAKREAKGASEWEAKDPLELRTYNCKDNVIQYGLGERHVYRFKSLPSGEKLYAQSSELQAIADEMCWRGVVVSEERRLHHWRELTNRIDYRTSELRKLLRTLGLQKFNPSTSSKDTAKLYLETFGLQPKEYTDTGAPSFNSSAMTAYLKEEIPLVQEVTRQILKIRKWETLRSTHVKKWNGKNGILIDSNGIAHPWWRPGGALSGRWIGKNPNPLNIPKPLIEKRWNAAKTKKLNHVVHAGLRDMYIGHGGNWLVECDYSQIEMRIAAALSNDEELLHIFDTGQDPHAANAWALFYPDKDTPAFYRKDLVNVTERTLAKNFAYLFAYGGDAVKLWTTLLPDFPNYKLRTAEKHLARYRTARKALVRWQEEILALAKHQMYVEDPLSGRRRYFWMYPPKPTEVYNFPIQAAASSLINDAIIRVNRRLQWPSEGILFQYHDALVCDGPDPHRLACILKEEMERPVSLHGKTFTFPVEVEVGPSFGEVVPVKDLSALRRLKVIPATAAVASAMLGV